ncbi:hypothetical protein [Lunatibacter salilacus]|uniref:hypothetical protein n=1 Tax=Lunatibacter salilacus TaxID=2483804 RepID=UPI0018FE5915|nr:hypothetical protein [Lunatibacter salilacus]
MDKNLNQYRFYKFKVQDDLILASNIILDIANLCKNIASHAIFVFQNGFKAARGDSGAVWSVTEYAPKMVIRNAPKMATGVHHCANIRMLVFVIKERFSVFHSITFPR